MQARYRKVGDNIRIMIERPKDPHDEILWYLFFDQPGDKLTVRRHPPISDDDKDFIEVERCQ